MTNESDSKAISVIDEFLERYGRELDYFQQAAFICQQLCDAGLYESGIRALVTFRAKRLASLRDKLIERNERRQYLTVDAIYADVPDLAGVRIALYFPGQREKVAEFIESNFDVKYQKGDFVPKEHGNYKKRFPGYSATHYRVLLRKDRLTETQVRYSNALIEIQVASVLMHAWSEVEHDLTYKPKSGSLSIEEMEILDQLNGLVLSGELSLQTLQGAGERRSGDRDKPFRDHYDLASYLTRAIEKKHPLMKADVFMGRVDVLFKFLASEALHSPSSLDPYLDTLNPDSEVRPLAEQVVDAVIEENPARYSQYIEIKRASTGRNPYQASDESEQPALERSSSVEHFLYRWIAFELGIRKWCEKEGKPFRHVVDSKLLMELGSFTSEQLAAVERLRNFRNQFVHGVELPTSKALDDAGTIMGDVLTLVREKAPKDAVKAIDATLQSYATLIRGRRGVTAPLFGDYARQYLAEKLKKSTIRDSTKTSFENQVNKHLIPAFGERPIDQITNGEWIFWVENTKAIKKFFNTRKTLVEILTVAAEKGDINKVPDFDNPDTPQLVGRILQNNEILSILRKSNRPFRFIFFAFWEMGCRPREILQWEWSMISWDGVHNSKIDIPGRISKVGKDRTIKISSTVARLIEIRRRHDNNSRFVFPSRVDLQKPQLSYQSAWVTACREAGVVNAIVDDFRRTYIAREAKKGTSPYEVANHLGVEAKQVERIYKETRAAMKGSSQ